MGTVFAEMSSWTALTWYKVIKTEFKAKNMNSESFRILNIKFFRVIEEYVYRNTAHNNKGLIKLGFIAIDM